MVVNEYRLRFKLTPHERAHEKTLFQDGRVIVQGTADPALARSLMSRYFGR